MDYYQNDFYQQNDWQIIPDKLSVFDHQQDHYIDIFIVGYLYKLSTLDRFSLIADISNQIQNINQLCENGILTRDDKFIIYNNLLKSSETKINLFIQQQVDNIFSERTRIENQKLEMERIEIEEINRQIQQQEMKEQEQIKKIQESIQIEEEKQERTNIFNIQTNTQCQICYIELNKLDYWPLECTHAFHKNCLESYFTNEINLQKFPIFCPNEKCQQEINEHDLKVVISQELIAKHQDNSLKKCINMHQDEYTWCPTPDCNNAVILEQNTYDFHCQLCLKRYCMLCRVEYHIGQTCKEYQISNNFDCPKCKFWVEKNQGCDHMTCRCKYEFCYKCGGVYLQCQCKKGDNPLNVNIQQIIHQQVQQQNEKQQSQQQMRFKPLPNQSNNQDKQIADNQKSQQQQNLVIENQSIFQKGLQLSQDLFKKIIPNQNIQNNEDPQQKKLQNPWILQHQTKQKNQIIDINTENNNKSKQQQANQQQQKMPTENKDKKSDNQNERKPIFDDQFNDNYLFNYQNYNEIDLFSLPNYSQESQLQQYQQNSPQLIPQQPNIQNVEPTKKQQPKDQKEKSIFEDD